MLFTAESPCLSVEAVGPRKVLIGREAQFVVKIRNAGAAANNLIVTVNVPSYAEITGLEASAGAVASARGPANAANRWPGRSTGWKPKPARH